VTSWRGIGREEQVTRLAADAKAPVLRKNRSEKLDIMAITRIGLDEAHHARKGAVDGDRADDAPAVPGFRNDFAEARKDIGLRIEICEPNAVLVCGRPNANASMTRCSDDDLFGGTTSIECLSTAAQSRSIVRIAAETRNASNDHPKLRRSRASLAAMGLMGDRS